MLLFQVSSPLLSSEQLEPILASTYPREKPSINLRPPLRGSLSRAHDLKLRHGIFKRLKSRTVLGTRANITFHGICRHKLGANP